MNTAATAAAAAYCLSVFYLIFFKRVQQGLVFLQKKTLKRWALLFSFWFLKRFLYYISIYFF